MKCSDFVTVYFFCIPEYKMWWAGGCYQVKQWQGLEWNLNVFGYSLGNLNKMQNNASKCLIIIKICCVCRGAARARTMAYFGEGKGPIHVDNVKCTGHERSLADCIKQDIGTHNCRHSEDAGVICDHLSKKVPGNSNKGEPCPEGQNNSSRWATAMLGRETLNNSTSQRKQLYQKQLQKRRGRNPLCLHYVSLFFAAAQRKHQDLNWYRASVAMV